MRAYFRSSDEHVAAAASTAGMGLASDHRVREIGSDSGFLPEGCCLVDADAKVGIDVWYLSTGPGMEPGIGVCRWIGMLD